MSAPIKIEEVSQHTGVPVWLLDIDGVVNAPRPGWGEAPHNGQVFAHGAWWRFRWSPSLLEKLRVLASQPDRVEIRWATTWVPWIREVEQMLRLPQLPEAFIPGDDDTPGSGVWDGYKTDAALQVVEVEHRPLIWTDDDVIPVEGSPVRTRLEGAGVPALLIAPSSRRGLLPGHMQQIEAFLSRGSA